MARKWKQNWLNNMNSAGEKRSGNAATKKIVSPPQTDIFHNTLQEHCCVEKTERSLQAWIHCHKRAILVSVD
jgi:hypothetical protein